MTDIAVTPELLAAVQAQLATAQKPLTSAWGQPTLTQTPQGMAVPIKVQTPKGSLRLYLQFGPEAAASPDSIMGLIQALDAQGYPLDTWQKSSDWGTSGGWKR